MAILLDTSILGRLVNSADNAHATATSAVLELHRRGEFLHIAPQNLIEFRSVATRPIAVNGLGLTSEIADLLMTELESRFPILPEIPDIYPAWKSLVTAAQVVGKQVHDARLIAICHVHAISHVLTFNTQHFRRLASFLPNLTVVDPATV
jgi:predicted nucleic acid-binding protein